MTNPQPSALGSCGASLGNQPTARFSLMSGVVLQVYVKGHRQLPRDVPEAYAPGSQEEAICFAEGVRAAWLKHPTALKWLEGQKGTR
jgi:hypothetical protein